MAEINEWNRALVTGASCGIGQAIAEQLADEGTDLVLVARNQDRLEALADRLPVDVEVIAADLSGIGPDPEQRARVEARLAGEHRPVDLLVNNAGVGVSGSFSSLAIEELDTMMNLNIVAAHRLAHIAAQTMAPRGRGGILNVSSVAGYLPSSQSATYGASKAFLTSLSRSIRHEMVEQGAEVKVTALCPGLTRTEFQQRAGIDLSHLPDFLWQQASEVAAAGLKGLADNKAVVVPGLINQVAVGTAKLLPQPLMDLAAKAMSAKR